MSRWKHAIVVGASSGMGEALVRQLAESGAKVAAVARRGDRLEALCAAFPDQVIPFVHDVRDFDAVPALFAEVTGALGGLDLVIYASGVMPEVGADEFDFAKDRAMIDVNVLGAVAWLNEAATRFGNVGAGTIVGIGSVAGDRGRKGQPVYNASKAFLTTYLEALRNRLHRRGVTVATIKPGPVQTEMTAHLRLRGAMSAEAAAAKILKLSARSGEHYLKLAHRIAFAIIRRIPSPIFRKLNV